jgi:gluconokinase
MPHVPQLRSAHARVGRLIHFGRMLDKIRLNARGELPQDYVATVGDQKPNQFDARCCRFLGVPYADVRERALQGGCDEEILLWAHGKGLARSDEDCLIWNRFMSKIGWRDDRTEIVAQRVIEYGFQPGAAQTLCELFDLDEGRPIGGTRSWEAHPLSILVVMGVAGSGKTTIGKALADALKWDYIEGDSLHPPENVAKMASGVALSDADRAPWLESIRSAIDSSVASGRKVVVACSALRHAYRQALTPDTGSSRYIHLKGDFALIKGRLAARTGHFMKESLLQSQFDALEAPESALVVDAADEPSAIIARIRKVFDLT